jgi:hypothetical protein
MTITANQPKLTFESISIAKNTETQNDQEIDHNVPSISKGGLSIREDGQRSRRSVHETIFSHQPSPQQSDDSKACQVPGDSQSLDLD